MANRNAYNVELLPCWHKGRRGDMLAFCGCWYIFAFFVFKFLCLYVFTCLYLYIFALLCVWIFKSLLHIFDARTEVVTCWLPVTQPKFSVDTHNMSKISKTRHSCKDSHFHLFFSVIGVRDHHKQKCSFIPGSNTHPCRGVQKGFKFINSYRIQIDTKTLSSFQRY